MSERTEPAGSGPTRGAPPSEGDTRRAGTRRAAVAWSWSNAGLGVVLALPAAVVTLRDPSSGFPLAVGMIVGAVLGVPPVRRQRRLVVVVGGIAGLSMLLGSLVAPWPVLAVVAVFTLCLVTSVTRWRYRLGPVVLSMGVPLVGAGLSETLSGGLAIALLMVCGSVYAWLVSLLWPEQSGRPAAADPRVAPAQVPISHLVDYGVRLGLTGSIAAAIGFALGWDHPGWACCAGLIVSRPDVELTKLRGTGRTVCVLLGAALAVVVEAIAPAPAGLAVVVVLVLAAAAATSGSQWYVTSLFTTFLVISMLTMDDPAGTAHWFAERVVATLVGVGLSYLFMVAVPAVRARRTGGVADLAPQ